MTPEHQELLSAFRGMLIETVSPIVAQVDALSERVDALSERTERIESEQRDQRTLLNAMHMQTSALELHAMRLDSLVETLDTRTNQIANDVFDLRERMMHVENRVRDGFQAVKQDFSAAFSDLRAVRTTQNRHDKVIAALRDQNVLIQQRLAALEGS